MKSSSSAPNILLDDFVDRLMEEKGLTTLDEETTAEFRLDLRKRIEEYLNVFIVEALPPQELSSFERLLDTGDDKATQDFLHKHIVDMDQLVAKSLMKFRATFLLG